MAPEDFLEKHLAKARVAILSEVRAIAAGTATALRCFVEAGGRLLVTGCVPAAADGGAAIDWLGMTREPAPWQDHIYLPLWQADAERSPVLVHGPFHRLALSTAEMVLPAIQPYDCSFGMRFGHATGPASFEPSAVPALTRRALGRGEVWYLEAPIGSDYYHKANYWQADWLRGLMERLLPSPAARVISEAGNVEAVPHLSERATWVFLINHGGEQIGLSQRTARTFASVPHFPIVVEVRIPPDRVPKSVTVGDQRVNWTQEDAVLRVELTLDGIWTVLKAVWR
jgi:hypothetical protein